MRAIGREEKTKQNTRIEEEGGRKKKTKEWDKEKGTKYPSKASEIFFSASYQNEVIVLKTDL